VPGSCNSEYHTDWHSGCSVRRMTVKPGWARKRPAAAERLPSTAQLPRGKPAASDRHVWTLNRDEQRTVIITFVGGLGSIIFGAVILGSAVALARWLNRTPHGPLSLGTAGWVWIGFFAVCFAVGLPLLILVLAFPPERSRRLGMTGVSVVAAVSIVGFALVAFETASWDWIGVYAVFLATVLTGWRSRRLGLAVTAVGAALYGVGLVIALLALIGLAAGVK
jgi:hypothetical protein